MPAFSLLSLNIEGDNHLDLIRKLVLSRQPDIFCVQEIFKSDVSLFEKLLGVRGYFVPFCRVEAENPFRLNPRGEWGIALFSRKPVTAIHIQTYQGELNHVPVYLTEDPNAVNRAVLIGSIEFDSTVFCVATTHFTWTNHGEVSDLQHQHMDRLLEILKSHEPVVVAGDFNAPRGKSVFARLAAKYKDNIPLEVETTIDQHLHRKSGIQLVVDGMFTSPQLRVEHIEVIDGVSDHKALFANISVSR